jgi:hypothetical protein
MSEIRPKLVRLDPIWYAAATGPGPRWLEVSVLRHDVEPGSPSQTVSQPVGLRHRSEPDHSLLGMP